jgi:hypothetical protein
MERSLFVFNSLKLRVTRSPLRSPAFLRLWLGLSISYVGDQFTTIALLWFVLQLTGSGVALSTGGQKFEAPSAQFQAGTHACQAIGSPTPPRLLSSALQACVLVVQPCRTT